MYGISIWDLLLLTLKIRPKEQSLPVKQAIVPPKLIKILSDIPKVYQTYIRCGQSTTLKLFKNKSPGELRNTISP